MRKRLLILSLASSFPSIEFNELFIVFSICCCLLSKHIRSNALVVYNCIQLFTLLLLAVSVLQFMIHLMRCGHFMSEFVFQFCYIVSIYSD